MKERLSEGTAHRRALWIALAYAVAGFLWIAFSDAALEAWVDDPGTLTTLQTAKGWAFVAVTALLLYLLLHWQFGDDAELLRKLHDQRGEIHALSQFREHVIDSAHVWIVSLDADGKVTQWNRAAETISGYSRQEVVGLRDPWEWLLPDARERDRMREALTAVFDQGTPVRHCVNTVRTRDGELRTITWDIGQLCQTDGNVIGVVAIGRDMTEIERTQHTLRERERQLTNLMDSLPGMAYRCLEDERWTMRFVSDRCRELTGYAPEDLIDNRTVSYVELVLDEDRERVVDHVRETVAKGGPFAVEYRIRRQDGQIIWVWEQGRRIDAEVPMLEGIILDITERKEMEQELHRLATHDQLTGLYNRREFDRQFRRELARAKRYDRPLALLWLDLDHFKQVNDRYGHRAGDEVLCQVSARMAENLREVDAIARYGGEEFVALLPEMSLDDAVKAAERLRHLVAISEYTVNGSATVHLTASIGVIGYPDHGDTIEDLYRLADDAMYRAKAEGRDRVRSGEAEVGEDRSG